jgi:hypothetical protein
VFYSSIFFEDVFLRLRYLQDLYSKGAFPSGSPKHFEILALEELESLFVQQQMKRLHEVGLKLSERTKQSMVSVAY